jgi:uncharacterized protein (TIGR01777 family)
MRILVTGATGFVGRALCLRLERDHHELVAFVRSEKRARGLLAASVELLATRASEEATDAALEAELGRCQAVVHLAGEGVVGARWSQARKRALHSSRVGLTQRLVRAMSRCATPPRTLLSASAVGYYGDRGETVLDESASPGEDFLARLCVDWESAAQGAQACGARVVLVRTGIVLGPEGGVLSKLLPPFRLGLGGRLGNGRQYMPWIALDDLLEIFARALVDERMHGAYNACAPNPVRNAEFTRALGRALQRPTPFPLPAFVLHAALGESASVLLAGQRALPVRWLECGGEFLQPELGPTLHSLLSETRGVRIERARDVPDCEYLRQRRPTHVLLATTQLHAELDEVAAFFAQPENLGTLTPPGMAFSIETARPIVMRKDTRIDYTIRLGPLRLPWRTRIEAWNGSAGFVDSQERGPYRCWWHEHRFERSGEITLMHDRVFFAAPLGWLGRILVRAMIAPKLRWIFGYRSFGVGWRFGARAPKLAARATGDAHPSY